LVSCKWTTAKPSDSRVEILNAKFHGSDGIGDAQPPRIMQVQLDSGIRPVALHLPNHAPDRDWICPTHCISKRDTTERFSVPSKNIPGFLEQRQNPFLRNVSFEIAAECSHDANAIGLD